MSITSKIYKGNKKVIHLYKGGKKVLFGLKGNKIIYADWGPFTFNATGVIQTLQIPQCVKKIHVDCVASKGRDVTSGSYSATGGNGGRVQCDLTVTGGTTLYIMVGDVPSALATASYNASDIRIGGNTLANRVIVAGGGGSGSLSNQFNGFSSNGGAGGNTIGASTTYSAISFGTGATGGTQSVGGTGAHNSTYGALNAGNGQLGNGGNGAIGGNATSGCQCGAGGAGYYGGGGGIAFGVFFSGSQQGGWGCGGGGGSSYTNASCSNVVHTQGYRNGAGYVTISFVE